MATKGKGKGKKSDSKKTTSAMAISLESISEQLEAQGIKIEDVGGSASKGFQCKVICFDDSDAKETTSKVITLKLGSGEC